MGRIDNAFHDFSLLNESLLFEAYSLNDVYQKYYSNIDQNVFSQIVSADPTSGSNKMGKYSKWLLWLYQNNNLKLEDLYKATEYLTLFHKFKNKIENNDIGKYQSLPELYRAVQPFEGQKTHGEEVRDIKNGEAEKVYEDDTWLVVVPHTERAACYYGKGTKWCTAATDGNNMFNTYNDEGFLYININKKNNTKYQFHFESEQFMDATDEEITSPVCETIGMSDGLFKFYYSKYGEQATFYLKFQSNYYEPSDFEKVSQCNYTVYTVSDEAIFVTVDGEDLFVRELEDYVKHNNNNFCILGRYMLLNKCYGGVNDAVDIYDVGQNKLLFSEVFNVKDIISIERINPDYTMLNVSFGHSGNRIFNLKTLGFSESVGYVNNIKSLSLFNFGRNGLGVNRYPDNIVAIDSADEDFNRTYLFFDTKTGRQLTKPIYRNIKMHEWHDNNGDKCQIMIAIKANADKGYLGDYRGSDVIFMDGSVIPNPEFSQRSDMYFERWYNQQQNKYGASV